MSDKKEDALKKVNEKLQQIQDTIDGFYEKMDLISADYQYDELIESLSDFEYTDKKLSKKQKEEKKQKVLELMKKKFPEFVKSFTELNIVLDGIDFLIQERRDKLESITENLEEIEDMKDEIERRKEELDY